MYSICKKIHERYIGGGTVSFNVVYIYPFYKIHKRYIGGTVSFKGVYTFLQIIFQEI